MDLWDYFTTILNKFSVNSQQEAEGAEDEDPVVEEIATETEEKNDKNNKKRSDREDDRNNERNLPKWLQVQVTWK